MLLYNEIENKIKKAEFKVTYNQYGEEKTAYTNDVNWYYEFAEKWEHTDVISVEEVLLSQEQMSRLYEIESVSHEYIECCEEYVLSGNVNDTTSIVLKNLDLQKKVISLQNDSASLWYEIMLGGK